MSDVAPNRFEFLLVPFDDDVRETFGESLLLVRFIYNDMQIDFFYLSLYSVLDRQICDSEVASKQGSKYNARFLFNGLGSFIIVKVNLFIDHEIFQSEHDDDDGM